MALSMLRSSWLCVSRHDWLYVCMLYRCVLRGPRNRAEYCRYGDLWFERCNRRASRLLNCAQNSPPPTCDEPATKPSQNTHTDTLQRNATHNERWGDGSEHACFCFGTNESGHGCVCAPVQFKGGPSSENRMFLESASLNSHSYNFSEQTKRNNRESGRGFWGSYFRFFRRSFAPR